MEKREKVIEILKKHNIKINVGGCGCCGSPWFSFEYNGEKIVDNESDFNINMIEDE